eukprot:1704010-Prymnesium_polylepis.1
MARPLSQPSHSGTQGRAAGRRADESACVVAGRVSGDARATALQGARHDAPEQDRAQVCRREALTRRPPPPSNLRTTAHHVATLAPSSIVESPSRPTA